MCGETESISVGTTYSGETVYVSVSGSTTPGSNYSAFRDYSGKLTISGDGVDTYSTDFDEDMSRDDIPLGQGRTVLGIPGQQLRPVYADVIFGCARGRESLTLSGPRL